jgi:altronate dehydratase large subunit
MQHFEGYRRPNGRIGVRNHVIAINTVGELAGLTKKIAQLVPGVIPVVHQGGKAQFQEDLEQTIRTLKGTAGHPNVSAALLVGMGKDDYAEEVASQLQKEGHYVHAITIGNYKSITEFLKEGKLWLETALERSRNEKKERASVSDLLIGLECGGSDAWSGITANPAIGACSDAVIKDGGTTILAETTEAIGAEHILAKRAATPAVAEKFLKIVKDYEDRIKETGEDVRNGNPTPGNIAGGLSTLEEKSLGCIKKGGNSPLMEVVGYSEKPEEKGFIFMDTPGYDVESVAGLAAGGAQIVLFSTGKGSPTGSPIVPVIKIGTNSRLYELMSEHIDVNAGKIIDGLSTIEEIGEEIYQKIIDTSNGAPTAAETHKNQEFAIWRLAESV